MPNLETKPVSLLVFGAHPDDIEFACGGVIAKATYAGEAAHFVVCSRGESATHGTPEQRIKEAQQGAEILRATLEFLELDGDAHLQVNTAHSIKLAGIVRRVRPQIILAPSLVENQHPDHARLAKLVRDATRLARYGGVQELSDQAPHTIRHLLYYAVSPDAEPRDITPVLIDVSASEIIAGWKAAMEAHSTQTQARLYVELQLMRARLNGLRVGLRHAVALFPNDPLVLDSLAMLSEGANRF
jgi:LmbE family N-acetylglucosaminyl deacetylase